jgi:molybdate transport system substrate-binding protein
MISGLRIPALALLAVLASAGIHSASAENYVAPDVVVLCEPTLEPVVNEIGALWRKRTGVPVRVFASPTALILQQAAHGVRSDIVIAEGDAAAAAATQQEIIKAETRYGGWRNRLVVARQGSTAAAGALSRQSNLLALAGAGPIAIVEAPVATAGVQSRTALAALGLWEGLQGHSIGVASTEDATFLLDGGPARLAVVYATDVAANRRLSVAATIPDDAYPPIVYWWAETRQMRSDKTDDFAAFLRQAEARERLTAAGLEGPSQ